MASQSRSSTATRWSNHSVTSRAVEALRRRGQSQQLSRREVVEQPVVRRCRRVMELVDDHDVECVRRDLLQSRLLQRLDHREDVPPFAIRPPPWISPNAPSRSTAR